MFLDLWSLAILTGDLLELILSHFESGTLSVSLPFIIFVIVIGTISLLAWRSTYIPDLPPVPRPPYLIQISGTPSPLNNNGERNNLSDVRLISSGADFDSILRRFPLSQQQHRGTSNLNRNSTQQNLNSTSSEPATTFTVQNQNQTTRTTTTARFYQQPQQQSQQQGQRQDGSVLLGLLRPSSVIRPFISNRATASGGQVPNLIVYHRVNVYHHHHHHPVTTSDTPASSGSSHQSQSVPLTSLVNSRSVDSSTQYDTSDASTLHNSDNSQSEPGIEIEVSPGNNVNLTEDENIIVESTASEEHISSIPHSQVSENVPVSISEGLRHRTVVTSEETGESGSHHGLHGAEISRNSNIDDSASSSMMGHHQPSKEREISKSHPEGPTNDGPRSTSRTDEGGDDIRFTIKFLNDTQSEVTSQGGEKVADFIRRHFATELSENKTVRLIFNGRVLDNETSTLRESGIFDQCVVHCLIVARPTTSGTSSTSESGSGNSNRHQSTRRAPGLLRAPEPGMFFVAFVGVFLIFLWFICFHFGQHLFTQSAVVSLTVLTAIFLIGLVAFYLPVHPNPNQ